VEGTNWVINWFIIVGGTNCLSCNLTPWIKFLFQISALYALSSYHLTHLILFKILSKGYSYNCRTPLMKKLEYVLLINEVFPKIFWTYKFYWKLWQYFVVKQFIYTEILTQRTLKVRNNELVALNHNNIFG
jgi:hypothetical protein